MELITQKTKRKLTLFRDEIKMLFTIWSHDLNFKTHQLLKIDREISNDQCLELSNQLEKYIKNHNLFEIIKENNTTEIVIDPPSESLSDNFLLNPISNKTRDFLRRVIRFFELGETVQLE